MPLVFSSQRIVSLVQEQVAIDKEALLVYEFMSAYAELRKACPRGDLRIHLSVEGSAEEVGAVFTEEACLTCQRGRECILHPRGK